MTLLVTGGTGFVMSVLARTWLERDAKARVVTLDRAGLDAMAERYFAPVRDRLTVVTADICDPQQWEAVLDSHDIRYVVHGATVTPISRGSAAEAKRQPEAEDPARIVDVNLMGTVNILEWLRKRPGIQRLVFVSSGSVYRHHGPDWTGEPLPEDGYVAPLTLYGISKFAAEMVVNRYADLFGLADRGKYVNTARTVTAATIYKISLETLTALLRQNADLEFQFVCKLVHELRQAQRKAIIVARRDAPGRIAMFIDMLRRTPVNEGHPADVVEMPMTRSDMGDFLNLAHESVSRGCKRLSNLGVIEFKKGTARILDRARFDKVVAKN